jgi:hypothetical protein
MAKSTQSSATMQPAILATRNILRGQLESIGLEIGLAVEHNCEDMRFRGVEVRGNLKITFEAPSFIDRDNPESGEESDTDKALTAKKDEVQTFVDDYAPIFRGNFYLSTWARTWTLEVAVLP